MLKNRYRYRAKMEHADKWVIGYPRSVYEEEIDCIQDVENRHRIVCIRPDTLGISLGRIDTEGNEIFEGDYNLAGDCVIFCEKCMGFQFSIIDFEDNSTILDCHNCVGNFDFRDGIDDFIVCGSIY